MLSYTFIISDSQVSDLGPEGPLVQIILGGEILYFLIIIIIIFIICMYFSYEVYTVFTILASLWL